MCERICVFPSDAPVRPSGSTARRGAWSHRAVRMANAHVIALASQYGRYGYRKITALLRQAG